MMRNFVGPTLLLTTALCFHHQGGGGGGLWPSSTPGVALAEARTLHSKARTSNSQQPEEDDEVTTVTNKLTTSSHCPFYGCPLTPQDVHYNTDAVKQALETLRQTSRLEGMGSPAEALLADCCSSANGRAAALTLTLIGYKGGPLADQINQDRALVVQPFYIKTTKSSEAVLVGVFDGHAERGEVVSEFTKTELPMRLSEKLAAAAADVDDDTAAVVTTQALIDTFVELDRDAPAELSGGCTASVILRLENKIYIANAGDSRSFVVTYRPSRAAARVVYISREDKPHLPDERARVEAAGGQVYIPVRGTSRVVYQDRRTGAPTGLAMSRSIGDWEAGKLGVVPNPIVDVLDINELVQHELLSLPPNNEGGEGTFTVDPMGNVQKEDNGAAAAATDDVYIFAVSATDGLMDYLEPQDVARIMAESMFSQEGMHPISAAEHLVFAAANAWQQEKQGRYRDDIAIAVGTLRIPPTSHSEDVGQQQEEQQLPQ